MLIAVKHFIMIIPGLYVAFLVAPRAWYILSLSSSQPVSKRIGITIPLWKMEVGDEAERKQLLQGHLMRSCWGQDLTTCCMSYPWSLSNELLQGQQLPCSHFPAPNLSLLFPLCLSLPLSCALPCSLPFCHALQSPNPSLLTFLHLFFQPLCHCFCHSLHPTHP